MEIVFVCVYLIESKLCKRRETQLLKLCLIEIWKIFSSMELNWENCSLGNLVILEVVRIVVSTLSSERMNLVLDFAKVFWIPVRPQFLQSFLVDLFTVNQRLAFQQEILQVNIATGLLSCYIISLSIPPCFSTPNTLTL